MKIENNQPNMKQWFKRNRQRIIIDDDDDDDDDFDNKSNDNEVDIFILRLTRNFINN